ncbi:hypothetical protein AABB24_022409, partial [Solanum stoloniferum]
CTQLVYLKANTPNKKKMSFQCPNSVDQFHMERFEEFSWKMGMSCRHVLFRWKRQFLEKVITSGVELSRISSTVNVYTQECRQLDLKLRANSRPVGKFEYFED